MNQDCLKSLEMFLDPSPWVDGKECWLGDGGVDFFLGGGVGGVVGAGEKGRSLFEI